MDRSIIRDVLALFLGGEYPDLDKIVDTVAESLREGAPVTP